MRKRRGRESNGILFQCIKILGGVWERVWICRICSWRLYEYGNIDGKGKAEMDNEQ